MVEYHVSISANPEEGELDERKKNSGRKECRADIQLTYNQSFEMVNILHLHNQSTEILNLFFAALVVLAQEFNGRTQGFPKASNLYYTEQVIQTLHEIRPFLRNSRACICENIES